MSEQPDSTRRAFLKGGALAAAPLAAAGAAAVAAKSGHAAEIERLQAEAAIRDLHQAWLRKVNVGAETSALFVDRKRARLQEAVTRVEADHAGAADEVRLHAHGLRASARYACVVETPWTSSRTAPLPRCAMPRARASCARASAGWSRPTT